MGFKKHRKRSEIGSRRKKGRGILEPKTGAAKFPPPALLPSSGPSVHCFGILFLPPPGRSLFFSGFQPLHPGPAFSASHPHHPLYLPALPRTQPAPKEPLRSWSGLRGPSTPILSPPVSFALQIVQASCSHGIPRPLNVPGFPSHREIGQKAIFQHTIFAPSQQTPKLPHILSASGPFSPSPPIFPPLLTPLHPPAPPVCGCHQYCPLWVSRHSDHRGPLNWPHPPRAPRSPVSAHTRCAVRHPLSRAWWGVP